MIFFHSLICASFQRPGTLPRPVSRCLTGCRRAGLTISSGSLVYESAFSDQECARDDTSLLVVRLHALGYWNVVYRCVRSCSSLPTGGALTIICTEPGQGSKDEAVLEVGGADGERLKENRA